MEDSKDRIVPEGEVDYSASSAHPPANKDGVLAVLAVIGDTVKTSEIELLAMAEKWQVTLQRWLTKKKRRQPRHLPQICFHCLSSRVVWLQRFRLPRNCLKHMNEYASQAQPQQASATYKFCTMIAQMKMQHDDVLAGRTSSHAAVAS